MEFVISSFSIFVGALLGVIIGNVLWQIYKSRPIILRYAKIMPDVPRLYPPAHNGDSGYDLRISEDVTLPPLSILLAPTGLILEIPKGYEGQVRGRSTLACSNILTHVGTIDSGYRGQVKVILHNLNQHPSHLRKGDRIAQLVISKVENPHIEEVDRTSMIPTERGEKGFGSTGIT